MLPDQKYADAITVTIDAASLSVDNVLTIQFSAAESPDLPGVDVTTIVPTVMVGLYGWDTKDFIIGPHERDDDNNRLLELAHRRRNRASTFHRHIGGRRQLGS